VVNAMNQVAPYDWHKFFRDRLDYKGPHAPLIGITNAGWKLTFTDQPSPMMRMFECERHSLNLTYSIGISVSGGMGENSGRIVDVLMGSPAAQAGVGPGMRIIAVNGRKFMTDGLKEAVAATRNGGKLELLLENDDYIRPYVVNYNGGARYPHLERDASHPDLLSDILKPHSPQVH
jgi:predicted metalloprotease with PDZ domain